jgi:hypothetical protein
MVVGKITRERKQRNLEEFGGKSASGEDAEVEECVYE